MDILVKCEEAAELLEQKIMEYQQEPEVQSLLKDLIAVKARISKLLTQARQGLVTIQDAKVEVARQAKELEEQKEKILKLDQWLETINSGLKESVQQTEITEEDIIRYIEIYERYIREYEEYEIILKSITVISEDESSQSLRLKLVAMQKALEETRRLVIIEIERLRQVLLHIKAVQEAPEEDISQTDRTIDSTSMPEEVVSPREPELIEDKLQESEKVTTVQESKRKEEVKLPERKPTVAIETQTGKSLMSEPPSVADKSVICQPEVIATHDVSISCAPPQEVEVQTSEPHSEEKEVLENIQVKKTVSDGHEIIEIASRPVVREQKIDEQSLLVDANYTDDNIRQNSQLNITHSLPQSFETVMVEPGETTTEVVVDADGTKRIIIKKVRKTFVTRQQMLQTQQHSRQILSSEGFPQDHSFSQITLKEDKGSTSTALDGGAVEHMQFQTYGGEVVSSLPGGEVTIQEFTSTPQTIITMEKGMKPEEILQLAEGETPMQVQTSSSSVTAVVQQVTKRIVKTRRRIIRRVVIIDGKEHVTEEIVDEPDNVEVFEEQIPRVSINVKDQGGVQFEEIDDPSDRGDQPPPAIPPDTGKDHKSKPDESKPPGGDKPPKDDKPDKKPVSKDKESKPPSDRSTQEQELQRMMEEFMKKEGEHGLPTSVTRTETIVRASQERESTPGETHITQTETVHRKSQEKEGSPVQTVTFSEYHEVIPSDDTNQTVQEYYIQEPQDGQTTLVSHGVQHSTFETTSSNMSTIVQKVTRKITRTRKRIIKHIEIIDGKEHVTEEVIEEPDDVEVIEEEPKITHNVQTEGVRTKRIRIIKQVQIIDGKEHVTEQVVEEPDDEFIPDTTITAEIDVQLSKKDMPPKKLEIETEKNPFEGPGRSIPDIRDITKSLIGSEKDHSTLSFTPTKKPNVEKPSEYFAVEESKSVTDIKKPDDVSIIHIVRKSVIDEPNVIITSTATKESQPIITETVTSKESSDRKLPAQILEKIVEQTPTVQETTTILDKSTIQDAPMVISTTTKKTITTETVLDDPNIISETTTEVKTKPSQADIAEIIAKESKPEEVIQLIQESVQSTDPQISISTISTKRELPMVTEFLGNEPTNSTVIDVTKTLIGSEMDHALISQTPTTLKNLPENKDVTVITEHTVTEKRPEVVTVTTTMSSEIFTSPATETITKEGPITVETSQNKPTVSKTTVTTITTTELPKTEKDTSLIDITNRLISSETDHSVISKISAQPVSKKEEPVSNILEASTKGQIPITDTTKETLPATIICETKSTDIPSENIVAQSTTVYTTEGLREQPQSVEKPVLTEPSKQEKIKPKDKTIPETALPIETPTTKLPEDSEPIPTDIKSSHVLDTTVIDITKSLIGSEIDHTTVSKIPISPIKSPEAIKITPSAEIRDRTTGEGKDQLLTLITETKPQAKELESSEPVEDSVSIAKEDLIKHELVDKTVQPKSPSVDTLIGVTDDKKTRHDSEATKPETKQILPSVKKPQHDSVDLTLEKTTIKDTKSDISVLEITKELLEKESIHAGHIHSSIKPSAEKPSKADVNTEVREVEQQTLEEKPVLTALVPETFTTQPKTEILSEINKKPKEPKDPKPLPDTPASEQSPKEIKDTKPDEQKHVTQEIFSPPDQSDKLLATPVNIAKDYPKEQRPIDSIKESEDAWLYTSTVSQPPKDVKELTKEWMLQEGAEVPVIFTTTTTTKLSQAVTEKAPAQSSVEVEPLQIGTVVTETDTNVASKAPELSYIQQFQPNVQGSSDSVNQLLAAFGQPEQKEMPTQTADTLAAQAGTSKADTKYDITLLLDAERKDTHIRGFKPDKPDDPKVLSELDKPQQTIDISMSITKTDVKKMTEPKVKVDLKVEGFDTKEPSIVKKDIHVNLPSEIKITREEFKVPGADVVQKEQPLPEISPEESVIAPKRSKKKKKQKGSSESSEPTPVETLPDTDKSVADTESSSLSHYVELPTSPPNESPKPTEEILEPTVETVQEVEQDSFVESEPVTEEQGYEAELSIGPVPTPDKKKRQRKRKPHGISEETTYPKLSTTESDDTSLSTPVEVVEPLFVKKDKKDRRRKKKTPGEPETVPEAEHSPEIKTESPKMGSQIEVTSPKDESYHTISEASDIDTVKVVEECVQSSPETVKSEVHTTITFPVPVVEEISIQEGSIQTSPEPVETVDEVPRPDTLDTELQTSPTPISEAIIQTTPVEDKDAHTQTIEEVTVVEKIERSDTEMQTSRTDTPEKAEQFEITTQVVPHDISTPEEKFSQTTPPVEEVVVKEPEKPEVITEAREMQTSPEPKVQKDEKSTEIILETTETDIQTVQREQIDQETSTTPVKEKKLTEMSIQTPEIPVVSMFTQCDETVPIVEEIKEPEKKEVLTVDRTQQTSPRKEEIPIPKLDLTKIDIVTVDSTQQTTPREPEIVPVLKPEELKTEVIAISQQTTPREPDVVPVPEIEQPKVEVVTIDSTQQTTPREPEVVPQFEIILPKTEIITTDTLQQTSPRTPSRGPTPLPTVDYEKRDIVTVDNTQQTSPREYSEDSISTSTEEPYEVHLRARITIPESANDFLENERQFQFQEPPQSIFTDKQKQRKKKSKKKAESPLSPESLSDPINSELSVSVTPTSEDLSSRDQYSIDEGISQLTSPQLPRQQVITQPKLTYSDIVQRSKSKSPSPSKTIIPQKSEKARLLDALEKRTQSVSEVQKNIPDNAMTVALLEPSVQKSYNLVINKELDEVKNALESNNPARTEKSVIIVIETISIWLEEIQYKIQRETVAGIQPTREETERLKSLKSYVEHLKEIIEEVEVNEEIITLIETLTRQVDAVNTLSKQSPVKVKEVEREWEKFQEDTDNLARSVERAKSNLDNIILSDIPTQQKLDKLDKVESDNVDNFDTVTKLFKRYRILLEVNPKRECPEKLYNCEEDTKQVENAINTERDRLLQMASLAEEYEQTLQDFGQITDVAEALLDGKIIVSDLDHLHEEIQKHRKFFVNLSHCRAILESLEDNLDSETKAKYAPLHNSLHDRATVIIDRAASRAQQMTLAASRWKLLEQGMKEEQQWLSVAQQRIPDLTNVTSRDHEQYINLYQSISLDVSQHYAKLLRLLSITESLQHLIVCSGLENECSTALDMLLKLQEDVDSRLTRLTAFKENWLTYDYLIDRIEGWMKIANRELEFITPENIITTGNLRRFWELKAQHEVYNNLKSESGVQFERALEILPISDEMVQRQFFSKVEDKWRDLANKIGDVHASAIQNISDRDVSSGEKLNILEEEMRELRAALDSLKGVIKSEDELNLYIERLQVMTGRIDRIQNELGRLSLLPTAESERVGALLAQSGMLDDQISEELERSLLLKEKIVQVQAGILRCQKSQRKARLTLEECEAAERLGSDVVERASETCERLMEDLASQWRDILSLRQALHTLPISLRVVVSPTGVERDISALQETHSELEAACSDLAARLRSKLQLWRRFERQLEMVQGAVREADYMVELLTVQGQVDYDRLLKATEKLETLSESLSRRSGELVGSLRSAAAPLQASTEPAVAAELARELDAAAAAYEHTCSNLTHLCDKYHRAVEVWKRYRDAAAAVRAFAEMQEGRLHALRPDDAPTTAQACLEQEARVAELRSLAARVAAETGSRALQADADALARRLQLVAGAVQALADLGEARQLARAKANHAKEMLCDMRQDLTPVHEDGEIVEDKLIALRDNLIALGKSEADIAPAKAELPDIDRDVSDEHSIVRILELWQAMFRDTFLHYHRLSTALVRSGDAQTALRLWHEYLIDLQSFLSGSVPADYENLTEHRRLCRVHRNLLTSQRSVLMNENRDTKNKDLADKFDTLTNLHNETLARIVERHDEVCSRIASWDDYREVYTELLRWLKEMEREKEKLQLRYVHIKRIQTILAKIQNLADKVPEGRKQAEKLLVNLKKVLEFTEKAYGASVRMEYAGIVKRVDNLQASLDTWRDFLSRILGLIGEYEKLTNDLHKLYSKTQDEIMNYSDEERLSRPQLKKAIDRYTDLRTKIEKTESQIETLSVIQEQLKECLSPQDIRIVNQKVWQLRQQRADLEHQLSIIIHRLQERLEVYPMFESRLARFSEWITAVETRLETTSQSEMALDPQDLIRRINSEVQTETAMKEREFEWITTTGNSLVEISKKDEKSFSKNTAKLLKDASERWYKLQETGKSRIAKIEELLLTISQLEERLTEIRLKLHAIESQLTTTVVLERLTTKAVDEKFRERDEIHRNVEDQSGYVGETLNLCELVFNDADVAKGNFDLRNLRTGVDIVEKKWKNICDTSERRKSALKEIRRSAELATSLLPEVERKSDGIERRVERIETRKERGESEDETLTRSVIEDLDAIEPDARKLEEAYGRLAACRGVELRGAGADAAARLRGAARRRRLLRARLDAAGADARRRFVAAHGRAVLALAETDVRLTRALHLAPAPTDREATLKELDGVEEELIECQQLVEEADRLSSAVLKLSGVPDMVAEYRALLADVRTRLELARAEVTGDRDAAVQVDTFKWVSDASLQVDTLTSKETYRAELASAVKDTSDALEALRNALLQQPKEGADSEELANAAKEIAKAGAKPGQTLELAKHLSELLLTECDATEDEAMMKDVESMSMRYEDLLAQAKKRELQINNLRLPHSASYALTCEHEPGRLTCPLCSERNWKQLDNDLWRLEQWLQFAEATDAARTEPPEQYDALEDAIQDHREFLLDLDSHKSIVVSLNVVGSHVAAHTRSTADADRVRARLAADNRRWDLACERAAAWQRRLQRALVHNRQFHDIVVELVSQLARAERGVRSREPLRLSRAADELQRDFRRFSALRDELRRAEPRVLALYEAAQLLRQAEQDSARDICRRLGELRLRLQSLRKLSGVYALKLGAALARQPAAAASSALAAAAAAAAPMLNEDDEEQLSTINLPPLDENDVVVSEESEEQEMSRLQRGLRFVSRVARASLPFQALLLLLLGAAALAPHSDSTCAPALGLEPVLRYPDGPPPL